MVNKKLSKKFALIHLGTDEVYGLEYVAAEIKRLGHKIQWFDGDLESAVDDIIDWQPSYICLSTLTTFFPQALEFSRKVKSLCPEIKSVFGGHHVTAVPDVHTLDGVDIVVLGPVFGTIENIAAGTAGKIVKGHPIPMHRMMPARKEYFEEIGSIGSRHRKTIMSHFGCPYNCSYCSTSLLKVEYGMKKYRKYWLTRRPVDNIIQEAEIFLEFPTREVALEDDDMLFGKEAEEWLPKFADAWKKTIRLPIHGNVTPDTVVKVSDKILDTLAELVTGVQMGVQAARRDTLKLYNRNFQNEEQVAKAIERLKNRGIPVKLELIIGAPVEDPIGDAIDTIKLAQRVGGTFVTAFPLMLYPGTPLHKWCVENNIRIKDDCNFDCYSGEGSVLFDPDTQKKITNISKMAAFFVKYNVEEHWMRALIEMDTNNTAARKLSESIYFESLRFQLGDQIDQEEFEKILANTRFKY
ncbi:MAG: radical SAM protein [Desulfobacterales bacterium]|nr:radical SAM protein [Desulfobacterales bacterium]